MKWYSHRYFWRVYSWFPLWSDVGKKKNFWYQLQEQFSNWLCKMLVDPSPCNNIKHTVNFVLYVCGKKVFKKWVGRRVVWIELWRRNTTSLIELTMLAVNPFQLWRSHWHYPLWFLRARSSAHCNSPSLFLVIHLSTSESILLGSAGPLSQTFPGAKAGTCVPRWWPLKRAFHPTRLITWFAMCFIRN